MRVGLTGGIGAGKSAVAQLFGSWGALVIEADRLAREAVEPGTPGFAGIAAEWPEVIVDGSLDRAALSRIIFGDRSARERIGAIVHPLVRERAALLEAAAGRRTVVVHVVPLLFEGDYWRTCACNVLVVAPVATRIERVMVRDGLTRQAVQARMAAQIDPEQACTMADAVIHNDADVAALAERAKRVYDRIVET